MMNEKEILKHAVLVIESLYYALGHNRQTVRNARQQFQDKTAYQALELSDQHLEKLAKLPSQTQENLAHIDTALLELHHLRFELILCQLDKERTINNKLEAQLKQLSEANITLEAKVDKLEKTLAIQIKTNKRLQLLITSLRDHIKPAYREQTQQAPFARWK